MELRKIYKQILSSLFIIIGLGLVTTHSVAQIALADVPVNITPKEFYVASVVDERTDKGPLAQLIIMNAPNKTITQSTDLQGGALAAINSYLRKNLARNKSLRAVLIGLKELKLTENALPNGGVEGHIKLRLSFGLQKDYGVLPLTSSQFALHYIRAVNTPSQAEGYMRSIIKSGLTYFNRWMNENSPSDWRLAKKVQITFSDYTEKIEGDTIYYSDNRKLAWSDFQARDMHSEKYQALVMPGIAYVQDSKINNGIIYVQILMKAYLPKSACWARLTGRDDYALNHEQRHFDITKIIAEQFKQKVAAQALTPDTYEAFLNMQYLDSLRDLHAMQKAYDKETSHGLNQLAQSAWNDKIDKALHADYLITSNRNQK